MNMEVREKSLTQKTRLKIIDVDIHPKSALEDLKPYLSKRWWDHVQTYGARTRQGFLKGFPYPKSQPIASRRDSWPPGGGLPASDLNFMKQQYLDAYPIEYAIMNPLSPTGQGDQNEDFSIAMAHAANEFQLDGWNARDPRLLASVIVPFEDGEAYRAEIRKRAGDKRFAHVLLKTRTSDLLGKKKYWPIYEAAIEAGLPVGVHVFGTSGRAASNTGWPSFYIEDMTEHSSCCQAQVASLILEGVFERYKDLKFVMIEAGFGWMPSLGWRMDNNWKRMKDEVPHLKKAPSEYMRENIWISTQPMEEAEETEHLIDCMEWVGWDKIMFSSDYPHWDFDDPWVALPPSLDHERRAKIFSENARALYRLD
jgi:predicted TIM-barrel fold metal-dependent hydrolase